MKKRKRCILDFWPYAEFTTKGLFWSSVVISIIFAIYGGLTAFIAGAIVTFSIAGAAIKENDSRKRFYEDEEI